MNAKENALRIIRFDQPAYVMQAPPMHWLCYTGCNHEGYEGGGHHLPVGSAWTDIWGTEWRREQEGVMGFPSRHPLADLPAALASYHWPNPNDERLIAPLREQRRHWNPHEAFLTGSHRDTLWEKAYMLVGMEAMMEFFYTEPEAVRELLRGIMDFQLGIARHYVALGVEMVWMSDDLGAQHSLFLSPDIIQEFFVPEYRRLFAVYKPRGVMVNFHSCGHIEPLIDLFVELGVDILNPIQTTANDLDSVRAQSHGRLALQGGVGSETVLGGPPERIRAEVRRRLWQLGRDGGYFCSPDQWMDWPPEHIAALAGAVEEFGSYPLAPLD